MLDAPLDTQITAAMVAVWIIQAIKRIFGGSNLSEKAVVLYHRVIGGLIAFITALGLSYTYDPAGGVLAISGLTITGILTAGVTWLQAWIFQQGWWRIFKASKTVT